MNDPAASGRSIRKRFSFKCRGKPRGIKPTGGKKPKEENVNIRQYISLMEQGLTSKKSGVSECEAIALKVRQARRL